MNTSPTTVRRVRSLADVRAKQISRRGLPGPMFRVRERDETILRHCREAITAAGMCRRSGIPDTGLLLLRGVFPVLLGLVHRRCVGGTASPGQMIENLYAIKYLGDPEYTLLTAAVAGLSEYGSRRCTAAALRGSLFLYKVVVSGIVDELPDDEQAQLLARADQ